MGAKTCLLIGANGSARERLAARPVLNRQATERLAAQLFPDDDLEPLPDSQLWDTYPPQDELLACCFENLSIVIAHEFGLDYPSQLPDRYRKVLQLPNVTLHAMHSVVDWFAFAVWESDRLVRALSLSPDHGILEEIGSPLEFERPYWAGEHPAIDPADMDEEEPPYPFPFHPLELGEEALAAFLGFQIEGDQPHLVDPESIPLMRFQRKRKSPPKSKRSWLRFWAR